MGEMAYRLRRWLYGSPFALSPHDREFIREMRAVWDEHPPEVVEFTYPTTGAVRWHVKAPDGLDDELAFRRYARRSGERVRDDAAMAREVA